MPENCASAFAVNGFETCVDAAIDPDRSAAGPATASSAQFSPVSVSPMSRVEAATVAPPT